MDTTMRKKGRAMAQFRASQEEETPRTIMSNFMEAHKVLKDKDLPITLKYIRRRLLTHRNCSHAEESMRINLLGLLIQQGIEVAVTLTLTL